MSRTVRPPFRDRLEFAAYRALRALAKGLPESWALGLGSGIGWMAGALLRIRHSVVETNLERAFPDRDPRWRRRVSAACYRHFGREAVMTLRWGRVSADAFAERCEVHGMNAVLESVAAGKGLVVVSGHLGNWELGGAMLAAHGVPLDGVAFPQRNRLFDDELRLNRERLGMRIVERARAARTVLESLGRGRAVALVADQNAGSRGVFVDFLGSLASTARGPALFSLRTGAPLFVGVCLAERGRPHRYVVHLERVAISRTGDVADDVLRLTHAHTRVLEGFVRDAPEQYFWQHKRWKTRPPPRQTAPQSSRRAGESTRNPSRP